LPRTRRNRETFLVRFLLGAQEGASHRPRSKDRNGSANLAASRYGVRAIDASQAPHQLGLRRQPRQIIGREVVALSVRRNLNHWNRCHRELRDSGFLLPPSHREHSPPPDRAQTGGAGAGRVQRGASRSTPSSEGIPDLQVLRQKLADPPGGPELDRVGNAAEPDAGESRTDPQPEAVGEGGGASFATGISGIEYILKAHGNGLKLASPTASGARHG